MNTRSPAVAGQFYPATESGLLAELERCIPRDAKPERAYGLVVPHAGYVYSGRTAGKTFARATVPNHVAVLSPNHSGLGESIAVWDKGAWETPIGPLAVDEELAGAFLRRCPEARPDQMAHLREHSLEVQLPFIRKLNPEAKILPVCLSTHEPHELEAVGRGLAEAIRVSGAQTLIVASSDMTHYESARAARDKDAEALARVKALDPAGLLEVVRAQAITMCGAAPVAAMLWAAKELGARQCELVEYTNSGAVSGDDSQVVGYAGLVIR